MRGTVDAFLTEHGRCWRTSGEDLETWQDGPLVCVGCPGCGALLAISRLSECWTGLHGKASPLG